MSINELKTLNSNLNIMEITAKEFMQYGNLLDGYDFTSLLKYAEKNFSIPTDGNKYVASVKEIEVLPVFKTIRDEIYGEMPIEGGYCAGSNSILAGLEYHQGSETIIAVTDCILLLGKRQDICNNAYEVKKAEAFFLPKGTAVELYPTTLHYTPCKVCDTGFMTIVILLEGTNEALKNGNNKAGERRALLKKNKWLLVHPSQTVKIENGAYPGLLGELIEIKING
jgi:hypothetical protein